MTIHASWSASGNPYKAKAAISIAEPQPARSKNQPLANLPMCFFELVKCSSGNMANGNCIASTTWLRTSKLVTLTFAAQADDEDGGDDGQRSRDQPADPGADAPVHEPFHDDLAGQRPRDRAALAAGK